MPVPEREHADDFQLVALVMIGQEHRRLERGNVSSTLLSV